MAWQDEIIPMLRVLINDIGEDVEFTDKRLTDVIITAARIVNSELKLKNTYTISMAKKTISPDPVLLNDDDFISLIILKSACLADQNTYREKAMLEGLFAKMGPSQLEIDGHTEAFKILLEVGPCKSYEDLKKQIMFGGAGMAVNVRAILSPFVGNKFSARDSYFGRGE